MRASKLPNFLILRYKINYNFILALADVFLYQYWNKKSNLSKYIVVSCCCWSRCGCCWRRGRGSRWSCAWLLTNYTSNIVAAPVIPGPISKSKKILVNQICHAVLSVPVIWLIDHPVKEFNLTARVSPCPVAIVAVIMAGWMDFSSNPVLLVKLDAWNQVLRLITFDQLLLYKHIHSGVMELNNPPIR